MPVSALTKKWQTTIPKEIRQFLKLEPHDKLLYLVEGEKVVLKPIKGNILELRGCVRSQEKPADFEKIREKTREEIARKIIEDDR